MNNSLTPTLEDAASAKKRPTRKTGTTKRKSRTGPTKASSRQKRSATKPAPAAPSNPSHTAPLTKTAQVLTLLRQPGGATLQELIQATGWQPHSVRGFLAGTLRKKIGAAVTSTQRDNGIRSYSIPA